jgi:hypothetical protein
MLHKPILALVVVSVLAATACNVDIERHDHAAAPLAALPAYPDSHRTTRAHETNAPPIGFTGSFADTKVVLDRFVSDDTPEMILEFYRRHMLGHGGAIVECRGTVNIERSRGADRTVCIERVSSPMVQLAVGTDRRHRIVSVQARGTGAEFSLMQVHTK